MVQPYVNSEGFSLTVGEAGVVYRFRRPVSGVKITATGDAKVGFNALIEGVAETMKAGTTKGGEGMEKLRTFTLAEANDHGYSLNTANDRTVEFSSPINYTHGHRGILTIWAIAGSGTVTVNGGSTQM